MQSATATGSSTPGPRFQLQIDASGAPLPVELQELTVQQRNQRAQLQWSTASETGNAGFYVQTRPASDSSVTASEWTTSDGTVSDGTASDRDAPDWTTLGFVEGSGTTDVPQSYQFATGEMPYGAHAFRLRQVDTDGTATTTEPVTVDMQLNRPYAVDAPYPNPTRGQATLPVTVQSEQRVQVVLYDMLGRRIATAYDGRMRGHDTQPIQLDTRQLASGTYFVRVRGDDFIATERLTVVR